MKSTKGLWIFAAAVLVLAVLAGGALALWGGGSSREPVPASTEEDHTLETDPDWGNTVEDGGVTYRLNTDLTTVLFLGTDDGGGDLPGLAPGEGRRADTILLLLLDNKTQQTRLVSISRDTMTEVEVYSQNGDYAYTTDTHLNMQYYYGDSSMRSCYLMKKAVSRLLYGIRIDGCLSLTAQGIVAVVDSLGGLQLTMPEDYTAIDPRYTKGAVLTLTGEEAERLLRYRDITVGGSNESRVERQLRIMETLFETLHGKIGLGRLEQILEEAGDEVYTDLEAETLKKLTSYNLDKTTYSLPGTVVEGEDHDEFHVDDAALRKLLISLFYRPVED